MQDQYWSQLLQYSLANKAYVGCPLVLGEEGKECHNVDNALTEQFREDLTVQDSSPHQDLVDCELIDDDTQHVESVSNGQDEELVSRESSIKQGEELHSQSESEDCAAHQFGDCD